MALVVGGTTVTGTQTLDASTLTGTASAINGSNITNLDAADLSGTLPAINGSNLTNLPSSAPTSSQVGSAMAGLAVNSIGTYCALWRTPRADHNPGDSVSGSYLMYTTFATYPRSGYVSVTWRTMGLCSNNEGSGGRGGTLFMRIS